MGFFSSFVDGIRLEIREGIGSTLHFSSLFVDVGLFHSEFGSFVSKHFEEQAACGTKDNLVTTQVFKVSLLQREGCRPMVRLWEIHTQLADTARLLAIMTLVPQITLLTTTMDSLYSILQGRLCLLDLEVTPASILIALHLTLHKVIRLTIRHHNKISIKWDKDSTDTNSKEDNHNNSAVNKEDNNNSVVNKEDNNNSVVNKEDNSNSAVSKEDNNNLAKPRHRNHFQGNLDHRVWANHHKEDSKEALKAGLPDHKADLKEGFKSCRPVLPPRDHKVHLSKEDLNKEDLSKEAHKADHSKEDRKADHNKEDRKAGSQDLKEAHKADRNKEDPKEDRHSREDRKAGLQDPKGDRKVDPRKVDHSKEGHKEHLQDLKAAHKADHPDPNSRQEVHKEDHSKVGHREDHKGDHRGDHNKEDHKERLQGLKADRKEGHLDPTSHPKEHPHQQEVVASQQEARTAHPHLVGEADLVTCFFLRLIVR